MVQSRGSIHQASRWLLAGLWLLFFLLSAIRPAASALLANVGHVVVEHTLSGSGQGGWDHARAWFHAALRVDENSQSALRGLGGLELATGHRSAAVENLRRAVSLSPYPVLQRLWLGEALNSAGYASEALKVWQAIPESASYYWHLAELEGEAGQTAQAVIFMERALAITPDDLDIYFELAHYHERLGERDAALDVYRRALAAQKPYTAAWYLAKAACHRLAGEVAEGRQAYEQAIALDPRNLSAYLEFADWLATDQAMQDEAAVWYQRAAQVNPSAVWPYLKLGELYLRRGDLDSAEIWYRRAIAVSPQNARAYVGLGVVACQTNHCEQAIKFLDQGITLQSDIAEAYAYRGRCHIILGDPQAALHDWERATSLAPTRADYCVEMGKLQQMLGDKAGAEASFQSALKLEPGNQAAREALQALPTLRKGELGNE